MPRLQLIAFAIQLALGIGMNGISLSEEMLYDPDVVLVMKNKAFQVIKGGLLENSVSNPTFSLRAGMDLVILLRNEDEVAHEFVSPLLKKAEDLEISGRATIVYTLTAFGVRVEPRDRVTLRFSVPEASIDRFHFWCNLHGKLLSDTMRGEIFILDAKQSSQKLEFRSFNGMSSIEDQENGNVAEMDATTLQRSAFEARPYSG